MEKDQHQDEFIRKLFGSQGPEQAPPGFASKVMDRLQAEGKKEHEAVLTPMTWIAIFLGAAALVVTMIFVDIPFIDRLFSSTGIQKMSFDIFNNSFYDSFTIFFRELNINAVAVIIFLATLALVVIERIIAKKRSQQALILL